MTAGEAFFAVIFLVTFWGICGRLTEIRDELRMMNSRRRAEEERHV